MSYEQKLELGTRSFEQFISEMELNGLSQRAVRGPRVREPWRLLKEAGHNRKTILPR